MTRSGTAERVPLVLAGSGFVLYAVADVAFALLSAQGDFTFGSPVDAGWAGGYVAIAVAARHPAASGSPVVDRPGPGTPVLGTVVTFLLFFAAALVRVVQASDQTLPWIANTLWVAVLVAVVTRQILVVVDNESLRHGLERRVQDRTAQLRSLASERERTLESVADGIYGVDTTGRVTFVNAAAAYTLGVTATDLVGHDAHATFHAPGPDGTPCPRRLLHHRSPPRRHHRHRRAGPLRAPRRQRGPRRGHRQPLRDDDTIRGAVVVFRDVTERREVERIKDEFVSVVSHELRTPLTAIRGALTLLDSDALADSPEQSTRMIHIALTSSERLSRLVDDILDTERLEAGTTQLHLTDHPLDTLVTAAVDQVSVLADDAGITLHAARCPETVRADAERIVQTLTNLLGNAVRFSPAGSTVHVTATPVGDLVEIRVDDQGRGIPPDKLETIFRRFEQVDASDTRERGGSGLGLTIARSIVEGHGGRLWAVSDGEGTGSSFRFTLHRAATHPEPTTPPHDTAGRPGRADQVIVVDDDPYVVDVLRSVLEQRGYDVVGHTDGQAALTTVRHHPPAAVVLDLAMPGTTGTEVLSDLRQSAATADVPVVILSATRPHDALETAALADDWLVKPVDPDRIAETVRDVIRRQPHHGRVLVVEDHQDLRTVVATVLRNAGLVVTTVSTVRDARAALAHGADPDVVVLDLTLPDGDGRDLVADLRRDGRLRRVPLVVYTGTEVSTGERDDLRLGSTVFLTKGRAAPDAVLRSVLDLLDAATGRGTEDSEDIGDTEDRAAPHGPADPPEPDRHPPDPRPRTRNR
nr:hypothetical protein GCM10025730_04650 [Promicromonospora thailandica]